MRLEQHGDQVNGDYDWKVAEWVGHLEGTVRAGVFRYQWRWDRTEEHGQGYFVIDSTRDALNGEWFYGEASTSMPRSKPGGGKESMRGHSYECPATWSISNVEGCLTSYLDSSVKKKEGAFDIRTSRRCATKVRLRRIAARWLQREHGSRLRVAHRRRRPKGLDARGALRRSGVMPDSHTQSDCSRIFGLWCRA